MTKNRTGGKRSPPAAAWERGCDHPPGVPARFGHDRVVLGSLGFGGSLMMLWGVADSLVSALGLVLVTGMVLGPGLSATFGVRQRFAPPAAPPRA